MKKIFTIRRVILLMSLILIYSCAFLFVKIYAEKSILSAGGPSAPSLNLDSTDKEDPSDTDKADSPDDPDAPEHIENIVNKLNADMYPMFMLAATHVSDNIEPANSADDTTVTTAPELTQSPATVSTDSENMTVTTSTEPPVTSATNQSDENIPTESKTEKSEDKKDEPSDDETDNSPSTTGPEDLDDILDHLGSGTDSSSEEEPPAFPDDVLVAGKSYKDETVTIYDTVRGEMRTENAFELVCQITAHEISSSYNREAIKAQAVAVYSYIKHYEQRGEYAKIGTKSSVPSIIRECVEAIDGLAMFYNGEYIMAAFSASTGGYSASAANVWGSDRPYLQSVKNDYDYLDDRYYGYVKTYTVDELRRSIEGNTDIKLSDNYEEWIKVLSRHDTIYADKLSIDGHKTAYINGRTRTITGYYFRTYILGIRSTAFDVSYSDGVFTFKTYGYGHGVGMSQVGANLYANVGGYTFDQILHHYYTGITIK